MTIGIFDRLLQVGDFMGPLGLLLSLAREGEVDLRTVPLSALVELLLDEEDLGGRSQINEAGQSLSLIAELLKLKVRSLMPAFGYSSDDGGVYVPLAALVGVAMDYDRFARKGALRLTELAEARLLRHGRPASSPSEVAENLPQRIEAILLAWIRISGDHPDSDAEGDPPPPRLAAEELEGRLRKVARAGGWLADALQDPGDWRERIASVDVLGELVRKLDLSASQTTPYGPIRLSAAE